jgi:hypothetical protein
MGFHFYAEEGKFRTDRLNKIVGKSTQILKHFKPFGLHRVRPAQLYGREQDDDKHSVGLPAGPGDRDDGAAAQVQLLHDHVRHTQHTHHHSGSAWYDL